jgi:hypothetical protein
MAKGTKEPRRAEEKGLNEAIEEGKVGVERREIEKNFILPGSTRTDFSPLLSKQMAGYRMRDRTTKKAATRETQGFEHTSRIKRSFQHRKRQPLGACAQLKRQAGDAREVSFWPKPESSKLQVWCSRALIRTFCGWSRASGSVPTL